MRSFHIRLLWRTFKRSLHTPKIRNILLLIPIFATFMIGTAACDTEPKTSFRIIGGSELKDLKDTGLLDWLSRQSGVNIELVESGSLAAVETIALDGHDFDGLWIPNGFYLEAFRDQIPHAPTTYERIFMSPVIPAVQRSVAESLGWLTADGSARADLSWNDVREAATAERLKLYITHMQSSNSGALGVLSMMQSYLNTADPLTAQDLGNAQMIRSMQNFFMHGIQKTSGSSGWLADIFFKEHGQAIINYENVLAALNQQGADLVLLYPKDGVFIADYPFYLINEAKKEAYDKIVSVMLSESFQKQAMEKTFRRPFRLTLNGDEKPGGIDMARQFNTYAMPAEGKVLKEAIHLYTEVVRKPSDIVFVIDVSGSMQGQRIDEVKQSIKNLLGDDLTFSGQIARFTQKDKVTFIRFNHTVYPPFTVDIQGEGDLTTIRTFVENELTTGGKTAIYSALAEALKSLDVSSEYYPSIVLLTDGEHNSGISMKDFKKQYADFVQRTNRKVPIYTILYGEASSQELEDIADISGGKMFDGKKEPLQQIFKEVRGYN
ncbi:MAG: VWA domain-containing protein [Candidatus Carbobacillus altaicus]|nr:VWA domain-containing protein [Candidatus Carbobacillus altaicus]